ncbi:hypothetical protein ACKGJO_11055 [Gracilimonas sp. Q87]
MAKDKLKRFTANKIPDVKRERPYAHTTLDHSAMPEKTLSMVAKT